jgi:hypothetical protein
VIAWRQKKEKKETQVDKPPSEGEWTHFLGGDPIL